MGAGTQALPVDTNPDQLMVALAVTGQRLAFTSSAGTDEDKDRQPNSPAMASEQGGLGSSPDAPGRVITPGTPVTINKPRGRPRIHPDRKAYKAQHERARRARKKESGNEPGETKR